MFKFTPVATSVTLGGVQSHYCCQIFNLPILAYRGHSGPVIPVRETPNTSKFTDAVHGNIHGPLTTALAAARTLAHQMTNKAMA
jgi:hypothetical protein